MIDSTKCFDGVIDVITKGVLCNFELARAIDHGKVEFHNQPLIGKNLPGIYFLVNIKTLNDWNGLTKDTKGMEKKKRHFNVLRKAFCSHPYTVPHESTPAC